MHRPRFLAATAALSLALSLSAPAAARTCTEHAYEQMDVVLLDVYEGDAKVPRPPELQDLDQLMNTGADGRSVLFWEKATLGFAKFYKLAEALPPTPNVGQYIADASKRKLMTGCNYEVPYTPILPGTYVFENEHRNGERVPIGVDDPVVVVAPGRDVVALGFTVKGRRYRAVYRVQCAYFDWNGVDKRCAPSEPSDIDGAMKSAGAPPPSALSAAPAPSEPAPATSSSAPASPAATAPSPSAPPPLGCAGCAASPAERGREAGAIVVGLGVLLMRRRRERRGIRASNRQFVRAAYRRVRRVHEIEAEIHSLQPEAVRARSPLPHPPRDRPPHRARVLQTATPQRVSLSRAEQPARAGQIEPCRLARELDGPPAQVVEDLEANAVYRCPCLHECRLPWVGLELRWQRQHALLEHLEDEPIITPERHPQTQVQPVRIAEHRLILGTVGEPNLDLLDLGIRDACRSNREDTLKELDAHTDKIAQAPRPAPRSSMMMRTIASTETMPRRTRCSMRGRAPSAPGGSPTAADPA